ncbi:hypothetical protein ACSSS7_002261 [Eimeria intestinalis]
MLQTRTRHPEADAAAASDTTSARPVIFIACLCASDTCRSGEGYDDANALKKLNSHLEGLGEDEDSANRLFYLALPPQLFARSACALRKYCWSPNGWNRVVVEKPFGRDSESSEKLSKELMAVLREEEARLHAILQAWFKLQLRGQSSPVWISHGGPGGCRSACRDVMQNHMMQLLTLIAMEPPASLKDEDVRDEKVKVLKQMPPIRHPPGHLKSKRVVCNIDAAELEEAILGQFTASPDGSQPGYLDDPQVPDDSRTPTFCACALWIENERWRDVPFIFKVDRLPDAYERLLLDIIKGDKQNFVRTDELREAWRIFTPLLKAIEESSVKPEPYPYGSHGPESAYSFIQRFYSYHKEARYQWQAKH